MRVLFSFFSDPSKVARRQPSEKEFLINFNYALAYHTGRASTTASAYLERAPSTWQAAQRLTGKIVSQYISGRTCYLPPSKSIRRGMRRPRVLKDPDIIAEFPLVSAKGKIDSDYRQSRKESTHRSKPLGLATLQTTFKSNE